jgi:hypothetical protein
MAEVGLLHAYGLVTYLLYRALGSLRLDRGKRTASRIRIQDPHSMQNRKFDGGASRPSSYTQDTAVV